jgi:hypothetical protein
MPWTRDNSLTSVGNRTIPRMPNPMACHYTDRTIPNSLTTLEPRQIFDFIISGAER